MMHKRNYEAFAEMMRELKREVATGDHADNPVGWEAQEHLLEVVERRMVEVFEGDNASFRRDLFVEACDPSYELTLDTIDEE